MSKSEINKFRAILAARQADLGPQLRKREGIAIEKTADALDEVRLAAERELTTRSLERESKVLREVRAALARIEEGTFGMCLHCEDEISPKRLQAVPWAALCIACQVRDESQSKQSADSTGWWSLKAA